MGQKYGHRQKKKANVHMETFLNYCKCTYQNAHISTVSLSCHEQVCLIRLHFERYFSYHQEEVSRDTSPISHYRYSLYLDIHSWTLRKFSFALNLSSWFSKIAAPCCFKTCHTYIIKKDYLNLFWLIASPKDWLKAYQLAKKNLQQFF